MRTNEVQRLMMQKLDRLEVKIDKLTEDIIPTLKTDIAVAKVKAGQTAKIITGIGGAITLAVSVATSYWAK